MTMKEILEKYKRIAVVGLSSNTWRASYGVSRFMETVGYEITPVNPNEREVLGTRLMRPSTKCRTRSKL
jgi:predicted CoA-binding protein